MEQVIFYHALEGQPEDTTHFLGKTERDIRVRWLVALERSHGQNGDVLNGPWIKYNSDSNGIYLRHSPNWPANALTNIAEVHFRYIPDGKQLADALTRKDDFIHFAPSLTDPSTFTSLQNKGIDPQKAGGISTFLLAFRFSEVDVNTRRAIVRAIDREKLANLTEEATALATSLIPPPMIGHEWGTIEIPSVPSCEPKILKLLHPPQNTFARSLAKEVRKQVTSATNVNLQVHGSYSNWKEMNEDWKRGNGDLLIASWHQRDDQSDDPTSYLRAIFHSKGNANWGSYEAADAHLDKGHHKDAVDQIKQDVPIFPLVYWYRHYACRPGVQNLILLPGALPKDRLVNVIV